jgi:hypothetical protein
LLTITITSNDSSHLGWPIPVLTPVPVPVLVLDGPIGRRADGAATFHGVETSRRVG